MNSEVQRLKEAYPVGTMVELISMEDPYAPVEGGTKGRVTHVDDIGTIHVDWETGSTLGLICGVDRFKVIG